MAEKFECLTSEQRTAVSAKVIAGQADKPSTSIENAANAICLQKETSLTLLALVAVQALFWKYSSHLREDR